MADFCQQGGRSSKEFINQLSNIKCPEHVFCALRLVNSVFVYSVVCDVNAKQNVVCVRFL